MYDVIIPCYKISEISFSNAIASIFRQKIKPSLVIIVIDGIISDFDIASRVIEKFNLHFKIIINDNNLGITDALNIGLDNSTNELIFRIDADDEWRSNHAELILKNYYKYGDDYAIYYSLAIYKNIFKWLTIYYFSLRSYFFKFSEIYFWDNVIPHSGVMINRKAIKNFRYLKKNPEDYATFSHYYRLGHQYFKISSFTVIKYEHKNSFSRKSISNMNLHVIREENILHLKCTAELKTVLWDIIALKKCVVISKILKLYSNQYFTKKLIFMLILANIKNWIK